MIRRRFIETAALLAASATALLAQERHPRRTRWEMITSNDPSSPAPLKPDPSQWNPETLTAAWIGHATVLLNFYGVKIITDPVLAERIGFDFGGLFTVGPRRLVLPALTAEEIPRVDLILLSHAHMDHLDTPTLRTFDRSIPVVMAENTADVIENLGFDTVYELDWGEWTEVAGVRIEALQVQHFGWRYPWEEDRSRGNREGRSYNAYLLSRGGHHLVFGGDTAHQGYFRKLRERQIPIELAIMPIGAYDPWIRNHANPEQALAMADDMGARHILPIHWNTFIQSEEPTPEPMERLKKAAAAQPDRIVLDTIGQTWARTA